MSTKGRNRGTPSIYRLMATYWDRYDHLTKAMRRVDQATDGSSEHTAAVAAQTLAGENLEEAIVNICGFVPTLLEDAKIKARFVSDITQEKGGTLDAPELAALIRSLPYLVVPDHIRRRVER